MSERLAESGRGCRLQSITYFKDKFFSESGLYYFEIVSEMYFSYYWNHMVDHALAR